MADAIGPTLYVGSTLKHQKITRRPARRTSNGIPVRAPEGMTRAEISEVMARTLEGSAEFLATLAGAPEITGSPAHVAQIARNLRDLAEILDSGADALAGADE
jgi:hypothetical protein